MKKIEKISLLIVIILIGLLTVFFGTKKVNYHCDEVWTYGLSNHIGGIKPDIEIGKEYTGIGPLESFVKVGKGEAFNYANVWENQAKDVHPPFYYLLVHTVCSIFSGTFSKWYGIGVNIFWMIFIMFFLYKMKSLFSRAMPYFIGSFL